MKVIDEKVKHILWVIYHTSLSDNPPAGKINTPEHSKTVYDIASESIVLLKNDEHLLPLNTSSIKKHCRDWRQWAPTIVANHGNAF